MRRGAAERRRRARRYARAIVATARQSGSWDEWERDQSVLRAIGEADALREFLENPSRRLDERLAVVDRLPADQLGPQGRGLLRVLIENRELRLAGDIELLFLRAADAERRLDRVQVTTATPLNDTELLQLRTHLTQPGRTLRLSTDVDPKIMGGIVVRQGDDLLDMSVRARLQSLTATLH